MESYLEHEQLQQAREEQLDHINIHSCRMALLLKVMLLDCRFQMHLLSCQLAAARTDVAANVQLLQRFPHLLVGMVPTLHLESGMYAQVMGYHDHAVLHFAASKLQSTNKLHQACCDALKAMALLARGGEGAGERKLGSGFLMKEDHCVMLQGLVVVLLFSCAACSPAGIHLLSACTSANSSTHLNAYPMLSSHGGKRGSGSVCADARSSLK